MIILYICLMLIPSAILFQKIKNKEYDEPELLIWIAVFIIALTVGFYYMDWLNFDYEPGLLDPDWIRK